MTSGKVVKAEIPHGRPSGMEGFVFNTRRPIFQDWRVRDALLHAFNYEFVNQTLNAGALPRRASYFANSELGDGRGAGGGAGAELLEPFAGELVPDALDAYALPVSDGSPRNRENMREAARAAEGGGLDGAGRAAAERGGRALRLHDPARSRGRARRWPTSSSTRCASSASTARVAAGRRRRSTPRAGATTTTT